MQQQQLTETEDMTEKDIIYTEHSRIHCKILLVTDNALIFNYNGCRQGIPIRKIEYFRYGV